MYTSEFAKSWHGVTTTSRITKGCTSCNCFGILSYLIPHGSSEVLECRYRRGGQFCVDTYAARYANADLSDADFSVLQEGFDVGEFIGDLPSDLVHRETKPIHWAKCWHVDLFSERTQSKVDVFFYNDVKAYAAFKSAQISNFAPRLHVSPVPADGNCLFHSLLRSLGQVGDSNRFYNDVKAYAASKSAQIRKFEVLARSKVSAASVYVGISCLPGSFCQPVLYRAPRRFSGSRAGFATTKVNIRFYNDVAILSLPPEDLF